MHARRDDLGRDVHEPQFADALGQFDLPLVLHEAEVDVVDGEADGLLVVEGAGHGLPLVMARRCGEDGAASRARDRCCRQDEMDRVTMVNLLLSGLCPILRVLPVSRFWAIGQQEVPEKFPREAILFQTRCHC